MNMMGGELTVESEVGKGTIFRFDLLAEAVREAERVTPESELRVVGLENDQADYKILVVEDNGPSRDLLVTLLGQVGFKVRDAADGAEAVEVWKEWGPDLIWMDLRMPVLDGYEATKRIRTLGKESTSENNTRIIALTASAFEENKARAFESGCDDFVRKPFRESEIFEVMSKQIGVRYVYADDASGVRDGGKIKREENDELAFQVSNLPEEIINRLRVVADACDADRVDQIIDEIKDFDLELAKTLSRLSNRFDYDRIMRLIDRA